MRVVMLVWTYPSQRSCLMRHEPGLVVVECLHWEYQQLMQLYPVVFEEVRGNHEGVEGAHCQSTTPTRWMHDEVEEGEPWANQLQEEEEQETLMIACGEEEEEG